MTKTVYGWPLHIQRSARRTITLQIQQDVLLLRVPYGPKQEQIDQFLNRHDRWIRLHTQKAAQSRAASEAAGKLSEAEIRELSKQAAARLPARTAYYAGLMGVTYGRITIRHQKTRWGSCSSKGNLNYNCLLMLCPEQVQDAVVVHELAHRLEMNHSDRFYRIVLGTYPEYRKWNKWLKDNGSALLGRL